MRCWSLILCLALCTLLLASGCNNDVPLGDDPAPIERPGTEPNGDLTSTRTVAEGTTVVGRVVGDGLPLSGITVEVVGFEEQSRELTDANGQYRIWIPGAAIGNEYRVELRVHGNLYRWSPWQGTVRVIPGEDESPAGEIQLMPKSASSIVPPPSDRM